MKPHWINSNSTLWGRPSPPLFLYGSQRCMYLGFLKVSCPPRLAEDLGSNRMDQGGDKWYKGHMLPPVPSLQAPRPTVVRWIWEAGNNYAGNKLYSLSPPVLLASTNLGVTRGTLCCSACEFVLLPSFTNQTEICIRFLYCIYQSLWQKEIGSNMNEVQGRDIWSSPALTSPILTIRFQSFKILAHWYCTPTRMSYINKNISPKCWRKCSERGTYLHCWLVCPIVKIFWSKILEKVREITQINFSLNSKTLLSNLFQKVYHNLTEK